MINTPHCRQITLTSHLTVYNLATLLLAIDAALPHLASMVHLQSDPGNGAGTLSCGNPNGTGIYIGVVLVAGQYWPLEPEAGGPYALDNIALRGSADSMLVNVTLIPR